MFQTERVFRVFVLLMCMLLAAPLSVKAEQVVIKMNNLTYFQLVNETIRKYMMRFEATQLYYLAQEAIKEAQLDGVSRDTITLEGYYATASNSLMDYWGLTGGQRDTEAAQLKNYFRMLRVLQDNELPAGVNLDDTTSLALLNEFYNRPLFGYKPYRRTAYTPSFDQVHAPDLSPGTIPAMTDALTVALEPFALQYPPNSPMWTIKNVWKQLNTIEDLGDGLLGFGAYVDRLDYQETGQINPVFTTLARETTVLSAAKNELRAGTLKDHNDYILDWTSLNINVFHQGLQVLNGYREVFEKYNWNSDTLETMPNYADRPTKIDHNIAGKLRTIPKRCVNIAHYQNQDFYHWAILVDDKTDEGEAKAKAKAVQLWKRIIDSQAWKAGEHDRYLEDAFLDNKKAELDKTLLSYEAWKQSTGSARRLYQVWHGLQGTGHPYYFVKSEKDNTQYRVFMLSEEREIVQYIKTYGLRFADNAIYQKEEFFNALLDNTEAIFLQVESSVLTMFGIDKGENVRYAEKWLVFRDGVHEPQQGGGYVSKDVGHLSHLFAYDCVLDDRDASKVGYACSSLAKKGANISVHMHKPFQARANDSVFNFFSPSTPWRIAPIGLLYEAIFQVDKAIFLQLRELWTGDTRDDPDYQMICDESLGEQVLQDYRYAQTAIQRWDDHHSGVADTANRAFVFSDKLTPYVLYETTGSPWDNKMACVFGSLEEINKLNLSEQGVGPHVVKSAKAINTLDRQGLSNLEKIEKMEIYPLIIRNTPQD